MGELGQFVERALLACKLGLEGNRVEAPQLAVSVKSKSWLKLKNTKAPGYLRHAQS
jgi:hypothetical protein